MLRSRARNYIVYMSEYSSDPCLSIRQSHSDVTSAGRARTMLHAARSLSEGVDLISGIEITAS